MYQSLIRPLLFQLDPEQVHYLSFQALQTALVIPGMSQVFDASFCERDPRHARTVFGLRFPNPVGLAAGFDKDARLADKWRHLGFGYVELGTVTPKAQAGNPKKRLFRLPADQAIINRMGFNNGGVSLLEKRLQRMDKGDLVVGVNIGKNKVTPNEKAVDDYRICFERLFDYVDYFVVNVSSPNTPGLRSLQEKEPLTRLLSTLQELNHGKSQPKPLLLKIAPDLSEGQIDDIVAVTQATQLSGLIATNTTISRAGLSTSAKQVEAMGAGGLSGKPLTQVSQAILVQLRQKLGPDLPLIGVGGIMTPQDAKDRLAAGANLIQTYTGFVYGGPAFVKAILRAI